MGSCQILVINTGTRFKAEGRGQRAEGGRRKEEAGLQGQLGRLADAHVEFYGDVANIWQKYVDEMEREGVRLPA